VSGQLIQEFEKKFKSKNVISFKVGDTIKVHTKIIEGEKERIQVFTGIVIAIKGKGLSQTFSVYRNAYGCCMERVFLFHSPRITRIEIDRRGKTRRSKLYHLRGVSGKKAKVKELILKKGTKVSKADAQSVLAPLETEEKIVEEVVITKEEVVEEKPKKEAKKPKKETEPKKEAKKKPTPKKPKEDKPKEE